MYQHVSSSTFSLLNMYICIFSGYFTQHNRQTRQCKTIYLFIIPTCPIFTSRTDISKLFVIMHAYRIASNKRRVNKVALECYNYNALVYNWTVTTLILASSICILSLRKLEPTKVCIVFCIFHKYLGYIWSRKKISAGRLLKAIQ